MTKVNVTNGLPNLTGLGGILSGTIVEGDVNINDLLILENGFEIPIIAVHKVTHSPGTTSIIMTVPRDFDDVIVWHTLYGKTFNVKNN